MILKRVSRRGIVAAMWLATAGALLAHPPEALAQAQQPAQTESVIKRGGTHVIGDWLNVTSLDPHLTSETNPVTLIVYNYLFNYQMVDPETGRHELKGELVETWEQPDDKTFIFKLRKGVKFHDGSDWNAEVAAWNLDRLLNHPMSAAKSMLAAIDSVSVIDDNSVQLNLKTPSPGLLISLTGSGQSMAAMVSKAAVEKMGDTAFASNPVGTGPFRFESWIRDDRVNFVKFDDYWEQGEDGQSLPYLDGVVYRYGQPSQLMLMLRAGEIEATRFMNPEDIPVAKSDASLIVNETMHNMRIDPILGFNGTSGVLAENLKLRQALFHALDREAMAKVLGFGVGQPHYYPYWGPGSLGWDDSIEKYAYDPEKAKQLMAEAGHPEGVDLNLMFIVRPSNLRVAELLQSMWGAVGFRTTLEPLERPAFNQKGLSGKGYDVMFTSDQVAPDNDKLRRFIGCAGTSNRNAFCSKEIDQCLAEGSAEYDVSKRDAIYKSCFSALQSKAYFGAAVAVPANYIMKDHVKGYILQWISPDPRAVWLDK